MCREKRAPKKGARVRRTSWEEGKSGKEQGVYWPPGMQHVLGWRKGEDGVGGKAGQTEMPGGWLNNTGFDE